MDGAAFPELLFHTDDMSAPGSTEQRLKELFRGLPFGGDGNFPDFPLACGIGTRSAQKSRLDRAVFDLLPAFLALMQEVH